MVQGKRRVTAMATLRRKKNSDAVLFRRGALSRSRDRI
jgi:hypothetical protein